MTRSYVDKEFGSVKAELERQKLSEVIYEGGWFGMTHLTPKEHYDLFHPVHLGNYPFTILEIDGATYGAIKHKLGYNHGMNVIRGDVLEGLFDYYPKAGYNVIKGKAVYRKPIYTYGHLDFCCNAVGLTENGFERNLRRLAKWWGLCDVFHLDITLSRRAACSDELNGILLDKFIPITFKSCRWSLVRHWKKNYCDTSAMTNAFYVFMREAGSYKKYNNRTITVV